MEIEMDPLWLQRGLASLNAHRAKEQQGKRGNKKLALAYFLLPARHGIP